MDLSKITLTDLEAEKPDLAKKMKVLFYSAQNLGAKDGLQRLVFAGQHYQKLTLEEAYHLINPYAFQREIEDAQAHKYWIGFFNALRNIFGIAPLIVTWLALLLAVGGYQADVLAHSEDLYKPFLHLWQDGFHHTTAFTFTVAAFTDVVLLVAYLSLNVAIPILETLAQKNADKFALDLEQVTNELTNVIAAPGKASTDYEKITEAITTGGKEMVKTLEKGIFSMTQAITKMSEADVDRIANAINGTITKTLQESQKVTQDARKAIEEVTEAAREAIQKTHENMEGVITAFQQDLQKLHVNSDTMNQHLSTLSTNVQGYNGQIKELELVNSKMAGATLSLAHNADDLKTTLNLHTAAAQGIHGQLGALNSTQQQMVIELETTQQHVIAEIRSTQGQVVQEISSTQQQVVQGIVSTQGQVVTEIKGAADTMERAAVATQVVATELGQITKEDIQKMTTSVVNAVDRVAVTTEAMARMQNSLLAADEQLQGTVSQINTQLQGTTKALSDASKQLEKAATNLTRPPWWVRVWPRRRPGTGPTGTPSRGV